MAARSGEVLSSSKETQYAGAQHRNAGRCVGNRTSVEGQKRPRNRRDTPLVTAKVFSVGTRALGFITKGTFVHHPRSQK